MAKSYRFTALAARVYSNLLNSPLSQWRQFYWNSSRNITILDTISIKSQRRAFLQQRIELFCSCIFSIMIWWRILAQLGITSLASLSNIYSTSLWKASIQDPEYSEPRTVFIRYPSSGIVTCWRFEPSWFLLRWAVSFLVRWDALLLWLSLFQTQSVLLSWSLKEQNVTIN